MIRTTAPKFSASLKGLQAQVGKHTREASIAAVLELGQNIVAGGEMAPGTPVDTGRARGAWTLSVGAPSTSVPLNAEDEAGAVTMEAARVQLAAWIIGMPIYWTNNVIYIVRLEFGHSDKAPRGFVRLALAGWSRYVAKAVAATKKFHGL